MSIHGRNKRVKKIIAHDVNPEDLFLDRVAEDDPDIPHDSKIEFEFPLGRFKLFIGMVIIAIICLAGRAVYMSGFRSDLYASLAYANLSRIFPVSASRGIIYDRNMKPLVKNIPSFDLVGVPKDLAPWKTRVDALLGVLQLEDPVTEEGARERIASLDFTSPLEGVLASNLTFDEALLLKSKIDEIPGLRIETSATREYLADAGLAHLLGYTGKVSQKDLQTNSVLSITDTVGKTGVEYVYDNWLRGQDGTRKTEVDARLNIKREGIVQDPQNGDDLVLSIDLDMQKKLYEAFQKQVRVLGLRGGAGIIMNPENGEILALVSYPDYDNNAFVKNDASAVKSVLENKDNPLFNRVVSGSYLPGSTIKPMLAAAGLEEGVITPRTIVNSNNPIRVVNQYDPSVVYRFGESTPHGTVNLFSALAVSSNVYFYSVGGGNPSIPIEGLGVDRMKKYFQEFGLGTILGIDLPQEVNGLVPSPAWKESVKKQPWLLGDTYNMSIGQGDVSLTPLQLASAISSIGNGGTLYVPHVMEKLLRGESKEVVKEAAPVVIDEGFINPANLTLVKKGMQDVVSYGTANLLSAYSGRIAAKTGTAQFGGELRTWFTGFTPVDHPTLELTVLLEGGTGGGSSAGPIAKDFFDWYYQDYSQRSENQGGIVPDTQP